MSGDKIFSLYIEEKLFSFRKEDFIAACVFPQEARFLLRSRISVLFLTTEDENIAAEIMSRIDGLLTLTLMSGGLLLLDPRHIRCVVSGKSKETQLTLCSDKILKVEHEDIILRRMASAEPCKCVH